MASPVQSDSVAEVSVEPNSDSFSFIHQEDTSLWLGLSPIDTSAPDGPLMLWNCFIDFVVEHQFGCRATEPHFVRDISAIEIWLIDTLNTETPLGAASAILWSKDVLPVFSLPIKTRYQEGIPYTSTYWWQIPVAEIWLYLWSEVCCHLRGLPEQCSEPPSYTPAWTTTSEKDLLMPFAVRSAGGIQLGPVSWHHMWSSVEKCKKPNTDTWKIS